MKAEENRLDRSVGLWVVLVLTVFAWAPALYPGYWQSLTGFAPMFNTRYPRPLADIAATADLWRGAGSATFLLTSPLTQLGLSPTLAVRIVFVLAILAGSVGVYAWLRTRLGDRAAVLAGLVYSFMPPLLTTVYVRGSLSDALVLGLTPLVLAGLTNYRRWRSPASIGLSVVALLWIWRTQAGLALAISLVCLFYALLVERDRLAVLALFVAGLAGALSLVPYWQIRGPAPVPFDAHFLNLYELLVGGIDRTALFPLGFVPIAFSLLAFWLLWVRARDEVADPPRLLAPAWRERERLLLFSAVVWLFALLLSVEISHSLWSLTGASRLFIYPGQILLPALPFLAATAGSLPALSAGLAQRPYWAVLLAIVILGSFPYLMPVYTQYQPPDLPVAVYGDGVDLVLLEATVTEEPAGQAQSVARLAVVWQTLQPHAVDYNIFFQALRLDAAGQNYEVVAQLDQQPLSDRPATVWQPGEVLTATYTLDLPTDPVTGTLRYYFGYYDWRDGRRLPLAGGNDDKVILYGE